MLAMPFRGTTGTMTRKLLLLPAIAAALLAGCATYGYDARGGTGGDYYYGQPGSEKSMPAILNEGAYDAWLTARPDKAKEFMRQYAAEKLTANPVEKKADKVPKGWLG